MSYLYSLYTQFFPPRPALTAANLPSQAGRVFIVTGGSSGMGLELARILYAAGGTVYIMTRSETDARRAIRDIQASSKTSSSPPGAIHYIHLDLADLSSIPASAAAFLAAAPRLDVLFNNAGVCNVPLTRPTAQGLEPHIGTNCVGPFLLTQLLLPLLTATAAAAPANSVRIIWSSSILVDMLAPRGGISLAQLTAPTHNNTDEHYAASKAGNWFLASELHRRRSGGSGAGVVSLTQNPGQLRTNIWRDAPAYAYYPLLPLLASSVHGAYTNLWAGCADEVTLEHGGGGYVVPYGRWHPGPRGDVVRALRGREEGGTGEAAAFWEWCEEVVRPFVAG